MKPSGNGKDSSLRQHIIYLLSGGGAHLSFDDTVKRFPPALRGIKTPGAPHTAWQLVEHMRIAQWDILEFSRSAKHISPEFPDGYWPESETPPSARAWNKSLGAFRRDLKAMIALVSKRSTDLFARIPHGDGQTVLREALLVADHNAYHLGQLVLLAQVLGARS
jgi:hypothetical protein